jgi:hypothetical protein
MLATPSRPEKEDRIATVEDGALSPISTLKPSTFQTPQPAHSTVTVSTATAMATVQGHTPVLQSQETHQAPTTTTPSGSSLFGFTRKMLHFVSGSSPAAAAAAPSTASNSGFFAASSSVTSVPDLVNVKSNVGGFVGGLASSSALSGLTQVPPDNVVAGLDSPMPINVSTFKLCNQSNNIDHHKLIFPSAK